MTAPTVTTLTVTTLRLPTAAVGAPNPLPPLAGDASLAKTADLSAAPERMRVRAAYGRVATICPYLMQDGYHRHRFDADHPAIVLVNEHLRATFLPGLGGRLWSLVDLDSGRELLHANRIFQPANLALRGAWLAGGVEWNIGTIGHAPTTCEPVHAARVTGADGSPFLRLYEFERLRRVVFQIDVHLPPGSRQLYVYVRITNPNAHEVPLYWWSNIAVPQTAHTRVFAPASHTWHYSYDAVLRRDPVAPAGDHDAGAPDISFPGRFADAADFFFDLPESLPESKTPWIAAVEGDGRGLLQMSTALLAGRKLFRWGTSRGGRRWQEWLSGPLPGGTSATGVASVTGNTGEAAGYAEIQAGLAATQFEHVPMPAGAVWGWTEAYGALEVDAGVTTGSWAAGRDRIAVDVRRRAGDLAAAHAAATAAAGLPPAESLAAGTGWGALEVLVRARSGEPDLPATATPFPPETVGAAAVPWLELLQTGSYPVRAATAMPGSVHTHYVLVDELACAAGWAPPALVGVARAADGDWPGAVEWWHESLRRAENPYARRHLALAARRAGDDTAACGHYLAALLDLGLPIVVADGVAAESGVAEPGVAEPDAAEPDAAEPDAADIGAATTLADDPPAIEPRAEAAEAAGETAAQTAAQTTGAADSGQLDGPPDEVSARGNALRAVAVEASAVLVDAGRGREAVTVLDALPEALRAHGRIRFLRARAALAVGDVDGCAAILDDPAFELADLREGEDSLDELFYQLTAVRAATRLGSPVDEDLRARVRRDVILPAHLDFRMAPAP